MADHPIGALPTLGARRAALSLVAAAAALAVAGLAVGVAGLSGDGDGGGPPAPTAPAGGARTSFGTVAIVAAERGPGGHHVAHHGAARSTLTLTVRAHNTRARAVPYSPGDLRLALRTGTTLTPRLTSTLRSIPAGATVETRLRFAVPPRAAPRDVVFDDVAAGAVVRLPLPQAATSRSDTR